MMELFPPDYNPLDHESNLPSYSRNVPSRNTTGHVYMLTHGGSHNRPWATLKLMSAAPSPNILPVLVEGDSLVGTFELDIKSEGIVEISLQTIGRVMYSEMATDDFIGQQGIFLNQSQVIWSPTMGESKSGSSKKEVHLFTEKFHGQYSWPFKLTLPRHVTGKTVTGDTSTFNLPAAFGEKNVKIGINYEVHVCIRRGKLHPGVDLQTNFMYIPLIRPDPASDKRQLAYYQGSPIPGPKTIRTAGKYLIQSL